MNKNRILLIFFTALLLGLIVYGILRLFTASEQRPAPDTAASQSLIQPQYLRSPAYILAAYFPSEQSMDNLLIEGVGMAGAAVRIKDGTKIIASGMVDKKGQWQIAIKGFARTKLPIRLDLDMVKNDGEIIISSQSLIIAVRENIFFRETDSEKENEQKTETSPFILLVEPGNGSRLLQSPFVRLAEKQGFSIETVDYDDSGGVIFTGSSILPGKVAIYVDDVFVTESLVDGLGHWNMIIGQILPLGEHYFTAVLVSEKHDPISIKLGFKRKNEKTAAPIMVKNLPGRVEIKRQLYGGGYQYTIIYSDKALQQDIKK